MITRSLWRTTERFIQEPAPMSEQDNLRTVERVYAAFGGGDLVCERRHPARRPLRFAAGVLIAAAVVRVAADEMPLKPVSAFAGITDERARSAALFVEAAKVLTSPRCLNCHPATREVTQGNDLHPHVPYMSAGRYGVGAPALPCRSCHQPTNTTTLAGSVPSIPGSPGWGLAPASMAWQGKSVREICEQIQDPFRNGGMSFDTLRRHIATDPVVAWGFQPGEGRQPAPGTQAQLAALIDAWIATGARCPQP
jgi:hypothetical protein